MEIPDELRCLFSAEIEEQDESYFIELPEQEVQLGETKQNETYRVAILPSSSETEEAEKESLQEPNDKPNPPKPPVSEGEQRDLEIQNIGDQGDGIARVERGFVVIVPDTTQGERLSVEITDVRRNVAFAEVIDRHHSHR